MIHARKRCRNLFVLVGTLRENLYHSIHVSSLLPRLLTCVCETRPAIHGALVPLLIEGVNVGIEQPWFLEGVRKHSVSDQTPLPFPTIFFFGVG